MGTYMRVLLLQYLTFLLLLIIWSYFLPHTYFPRKSSTNQVLDSVFQRSICFIRESSWLLLLDDVPVSEAVLLSES